MHSNCTICPALYCTVQCSTVQYNAEQCNTILYSTVQCSTVKYNTVKYSTVHAKMVERTKLVIEAIGFTQIIRGVTRTWRRQRDSLLDQCWVNNPQRIISHDSEVRSFSDHNILSIIIRTKDRFPSGQEMTRRQWKNFDPTHFRKLVSEIDWSFFYETSNVEIKNSIFEEKISNILDLLAPYKNFQIRKKFRNWVDVELKNLMKNRDLQRGVARISDSDEDWLLYRKSY